MSSRQSELVNIEASITNTQHTTNSPEPVSGDLDMNSTETSFSTGESLAMDKQLMSATSPEQDVSPLPPRKRARTKDEKEQRRVERIMRNRQAAHASREKKRRHIEELESRCERLTSETTELEAKLSQSQRAQAQSFETQSNLLLRIEQLEAAIALAKRSGDLSVLDVGSHSSTVAVAAQYTNTPSTPSSMSSGDSSSESFSCASPDMLQLGLVPALTNSNSNSPRSVDDEALLEELDSMLCLPAVVPPLESNSVAHSAATGAGATFAKTNQYSDSSSKAHHPAVMM